MPRSPHVQFRAGELAPLLEERAREGDSSGSIAARDLERYYRTLSDELRRVPLEEPEWNVLRDSLNGYLHTPALPAHIALLANVEDSLQLDGLARKWQTDGDGLLAKLRALTPTQALAVIDQVERWWNQQGARPLADRKAGSARGAFVVPEDLDAPIDES
jgi:hypothetical protein